MMSHYDRDMTMTALKRTLPYVRLFKNRVFVVKAGGALCGDSTGLHELALQLGLLRELGIRVVLVHGGGPQTTSLSERLGLKTEFVDGRRITSDKTLEVAVMTLNGSVNTAILSACRAADVPAVGLSGLDAALVRARRRPPQHRDRNGASEVIDYGLVGDIVSVDAGVLEKLLAAGLMPVVSPMAADDDGQVLNINADTVASSIAQAIGAEKLIFLTDTAGLLEKKSDPASLVSYTDLSGLESLEARGVMDAGMLPKVTAARQALKGGVRRVHMVAYRSLLLEIFTNEGAGTLIVKDASELLPAEQAVA